MKVMMILIAMLVLSSVGAVAGQKTATPEEKATEKGMPATPHQKETPKEIKSDLFKQLDKDGDGAISEQEAQAESKLSKSWSKFDKNGDGKLDREEFAKFEQNVAVKEEVAEVGAEGETEEEMPVSPMQPEVEKEVKSEYFKKLDKDGDGAISKEEAQAESKLSKNWDQFDENGDGKIDPGELGKFEQKFPRQDKKGY